jgi:hypothetical protein
MPSPWWLQLHPRQRPEEAFAALREISQHTNVKLHDVAAVLVAAGSRTEAGRRADRQFVDTVLADVRVRSPLSPDRSP